ncbi:hypothetical protein DPMN_174651 [Dreissena polymorpha]|uniref:Uncharacterized protein n=1 Tax=Dreissena polymorpha TaxID=45954 RepID=A0A9D4E3R9_DREPO|nr:hypothetical protein DPMN_174651 [Dreissena polymorpha]
MNSEHPGGTKNALPPEINVASRVLTSKNAPSFGGNVLEPTQNIFKLVQDIIWMNSLTKFYEDRTIQLIIGTNLLTKFHEDRTINVASRVLTRKNDPPSGGHVFRATGTIFKLVQDIIGTNLLTKFHND